MKATLSEFDYERKSSKEKFVRLTPHLKRFFGYSPIIIIIIKIARRKTISHLSALFKVKVKSC